MWVGPTWRWLVFETKSEALAAKEVFIREKQEHLANLEERHRWSDWRWVRELMDSLRAELKQLQDAHPARMKITKPALVALGGRLSFTLWWATLDEELQVLIPDEIPPSMWRFFAG